ncbi:carboxylate-amine ligase [Arthrobacter halodurans]|uniref:Putative glutamate--cysteine ligase 2 n=1 Tax=Arthrobacter halodurans TaxID=516699 RepID=A0ABV4UJG2_9MICC
MTRFGIEEEFLLVDAATGLPAVPGESEIEALCGIEGGGSRTHQELLTCQVESASPVLEDAEQALASLRGYRRALEPGAVALGFRGLGIGAAPLAPEWPAPATNTPRYRGIEALAAGIVGDQYVSGLHVHVEVPDREAGVRALNSLRPWIPLLVAIGGNSPLWRGRDTGFASWRTIHYRRWSVQGIPPLFAGADDYDTRLERMLATDTVLDTGYLAWTARLSSRYPTVEVRAADTQLEARDAVLIALMVRALVRAELEDPAVPDPGAAGPELLDVALWQAAQAGLDGRLLDPRDGASRPAGDVLAALLRRIGPFLRIHGDTEFVDSGLRRLEREGAGARRQRDVLASGGVSGLIAYAAAALPR